MLHTRADGCELIQAKVTDQSHAVLELQPEILLLFQNRSRDSSMLLHIGELNLAKFYITAYKAENVPLERPVPYLK